MTSEFTSDENKNNSLKAKVNTSPKRRSSSSSIPVSNVNNLDLIKQKLSNKSSSSYNKQERDIFLRNSLSSFGQVSKIKQTDCPVSPSYQRSWNSSNKFVQKADKDVSNPDSSSSSRPLNRTVNKSESTSERVANKPIGAVAALGLTNLERKKSSEYSPYRNKYLIKKETIYSPKKKTPTVPDSLSHKDVETKRPDNCRFLDLKCCQRVTTPPEVNERNKILYSNMENIDDTGSEKSTFSSATLDSGISSRGQPNELELSIENSSTYIKPLEDVGKTILSQKNENQRITDSLNSNSYNRSSISSNAFQKDIQGLHAIDTSEQYIIENIPTEIANLQQVLLAEVEKISRIEPQKQDSPELEDENVSICDQKDVPAPSRSESQEDPNLNNTSKPSKMKRVSTYVQIFNKGSQNKSKNVKKSVSLGNEFEEQQKSCKIEQEKERSVLKSVFMRRNIFEKKNDAKEKASKKIQIPLVHSAKETKSSISKFGFYSRNSKGKECSQSMKLENNGYGNSEAIPPDSGFFESSSTTSTASDSKIIKQYSPRTQSLRNSPLPSKVNNTRKNSESSWQEDSPIKNCQISDTLLLEVTDALNQKRDRSCFSSPVESPEDEKTEIFFNNIKMNENDKSLSNVDNDEKINMNKLLDTFDNDKAFDSEMNNIRRESEQSVDSVGKVKINALISKFESNR